MKKLASIVVACLLFSLIFHPLASGGSKEAEIIIQQYKWNGIETVERKMCREEAFQLIENLKKLEEAIKNNKEEEIVKLSHELEKNGFYGSSIYKLLEGINVTWNLSNLFCLTFGFGMGAFLYMPENLLIIAALLGIIKFSTFWDLIAFMAYVAIFAIISHLIPFRIALPITFFAVAEGELITAGLKGVKIFQPEDNITVGGVIIGFIGLVINIIIPMEKNPLSYFFCIGYSLLVLEPYLENNFRR